MSAANALFKLVSEESMGMGEALGALALRRGQTLLPLFGAAAAPADAYRIAVLRVARVALMAAITARGLEAGTGANLLAPASPKLARRADRNPAFASQSERRRPWGRRRARSMTYFLRCLPAPMAAEAAGTAMAGGAPLTASWTFLGFFDSLLPR